MSKRIPTEMPEKVSRKIMENLFLEGIPEKKTLKELQERYVEKPLKELWRQNLMSNS